MAALRVSACRTVCPTLLWCANYLRRLAQVLILVDLTTPFSLGMDFTVSVTQLLDALQTLQGVVRQVRVPPNLSCWGVPRLLPRQAATILNRRLRMDVSRSILIRLFLLADLC